MVVPAGVGATFEVSKSETCFQLAVVVLHAPPDLGQADEFLQWCQDGQSREPVIGRGGCPGGPFCEQPLHGRGTVIAAGKIAVRGPDAEGDESGFYRGGLVVRSGFRAAAPRHLVEG